MCSLDICLLYITFCHAVLPTHACVCHVFFCYLNTSRQPSPCQPACLHCLYACCLTHLPTPPPCLQAHPPALPHFPSPTPLTSNLPTVPLLGQLPLGDRDLGSFPCSAQLLLSSSSPFSPTLCVPMPTLPQCLLGTPLLLLILPSPLVSLEFIHSFSHSPDPLILPPLHFVIPFCKRMESTLGRGRGKALSISVSPIGDRGDWSTARRRRRRRRGRLEGKAGKAGKRLGAWRQWPLLLLLLHPSILHLSAIIGVTTMGIMGASPKHLHPPLYIYRH